MAEAVGDVKTCTGCGVEKPLDEYHRHKHGKHGRESRCRECKRAYHAEWYTENSEVQRVYRAEYYAQNREALLAYKGEYRAANPHVFWEGKARHRAHQQGHSITVESFTREELMEMYGNACWHCGGEFEELDHYPIPISRGGHHVIENCKPSCTPCNRKSWRE